jgi:plastocyanin
MTQRSISRLRTPAIVALSVALVSLGIVACFSDRATGAATGTGTPCSTPANAAGSTVVFIKSFAFLPPTIHVKAGESVVWVNCEPTNIPHTSTDDGGSWDSGSLSPSADFVHLFPTPGTFTMHCAIHPFMKATVVVD